MNQFSASIRAAYERWAPQYPASAHNPLMRVEQALMLESCPDPTGLGWLDLAAGSGRYAKLLLDQGAAEVVAVDFCLSMLQQVACAQRVCGSMLQLPFGDAAFDGVICGLALGHAADLRAFMSESARVLRAGGALLYSDFHPEAARAEMTRSFTDSEQRKWTVPHHVHSIDAQLEALQAAGLKSEVVREARVGMELQEAFRGSEEFYERWHGLPLVLIVRARK